MLFGYLSGDQTQSVNRMHTQNALWSYYELKILSTFVSLITIELFVSSAFDPTKIVP